MMFDFNETNILRQNLFSQTDTKETLITRLSALLETADEPILRNSVSTLIYKLRSLSPEQINHIKQDIENKKLIATTSYRVK